MVEKKSTLMLFLITLSCLLLVSLTSATLSDWYHTITGRATSQNFNINISIGNTAPNITTVVIGSSFNPTEDGVTNININFTAYDTDGFGNLNDNSARANVTLSGEATRQNTTCTKLSTFGSYYANYTCTIGMQYFDGQGSWTVRVAINDTSNAQGFNQTKTFTYNSLSAFVQGPGSITFASLSPGSTNQTASNDPILLNNTGNAEFTDGGVQINATNLKGETDSSKAIWAGNFTAAIITGSSTECRTTSNMTASMSAGVFTAVSNATLPKGNHSLNDGTTGQEQLYFCITTIGSELSSQAYSTQNEGAWTTKIV